MSYKTILVALNDIEGRDALIAAAARLGSLFEAHVTGIYVVPAVQVYPTGGIDLMPQVFEGTRIYFQSQAEATRKAFEEAMRREGVSFGFVHTDSASTILADDVVEATRSADLVLAMPPADQSSGWIETDFAERVVMGSGRPVLLIPRGFKGLAFGEAIIGWNASREASRAAFDAVPLLKACKAARIVTVDPETYPAFRGEVPGADLAEALDRHGIKAITEPLRTSGTEAGRALLQHANDIGASLIVLGAYGHSRLRELILGGATREMLTSLDRPVLMVH
jgi:nucleotide-binding universal stress UspA family protein